MKKLFFFLLFYSQIAFSQEVAKSQELKIESENLTIEKPQNLDEKKIVYKFENVDKSRFQNRARIQILEKITAKSQNFDVKVGEKMKFENLEVKVHKCWQAPLHEKPDSKILVEVTEKKSQEDQQLQEVIFFGWLIASSPSISGISHPVYDIVALKCFNQDLKNQNEK